MKLVKDIIEGRIVYYWVEDASNLTSLSPYLHSLIEAEEWWKTYQFSLYSGQERRRSIHDRRHNHEKRKQLELREKYNRTNPSGRRTTDVTVKVDIDLSKAKLMEIRCGYE